MFGWISEYIKLPLACFGERLFAVGRCGWIDGYSYQEKELIRKTKKKPLIKGVFEKKFLISFFCFKMKFKFTKKITILKIPDNWKAKNRI